MAASKAAALALAAKKSGTGTFSSLRAGAVVDARPVGFANIRRARRAACGGYRGRAVARRSLERVRTESDSTEVKKGTGIFSR
jgi:hypothetical protein